VRRKTPPKEKKKNRHTKKKNIKSSTANVLVLKTKDNLTGEKRCSKARPALPGRTKSRGTTERRKRVSAVTKEASKVAKIRGKKNNGSP